MKQQITILIADDEFTIRQGLASLPWTTIGITKVIAVANGEEAKSVLDAYNVDIILSDIKMPGFTGLDIASYVRQYSIDAIVILISGFAEFSMAQEALRNNVYDYILKPINPKKLFEIVGKAVEMLYQKRYLENAVRLVEERAGSYDTMAQIKNCFFEVSSQMDEILSYIASNFSSDITLPLLSEKYHFSITYLSRMFRKETGYSFLCILNAVRILNACWQLQKTNRKIGSICEDVGIHDFHYFSQVFKKVFGCTPRDYRKETQTVNLKFILEMMDKK